MAHIPISHPPAVAMVLMTNYGVAIKKVSTSNNEVSLSWASLRLIAPLVHETYSIHVVCDAAMHPQAYE